MMPDLTPHHVRAIGLSDVGTATRLTLTLGDLTHHDLPGFRPDITRLADLIDRARELAAHRKVYIHPQTGAVTLNPTGELDLAGMLASEGLGEITKPTA